MHKRLSFRAFRTFTLVLAVGLGLALASACSTDDAASSGNAAGQAGAGEASSNGGAPMGGGSAASEGGAQVAAGAGADAGAGVDAGSAGMAAGGAPTAGGDCLVVLSENTSNAVDATTPLSDTCRATTFAEQINFEALSPDGRNLTVDFFEPPLTGASVKLEDGYDFEAHQGAAASYMDSVGVWNADSGTVTVESVTGDTYVVKLVDVHFAVLPGQPVAPATTGEFVANGTITATAMVGH